MTSFNFKGYKMKKIILAMLVVFTTIFSGCGDEAGTTPVSPTITSIEMNASTETLPLGLSVTMTTTAYLSDNTSINVTDEAVYTSSDETILIAESNTTVNMLSSKGVGSSLVTAQYAGYDANLSINVTNANLVSILVTSEQLTIGLGQTIQFSANGTYTDDSIINMSADVNWTLSDEAVSTIDSSGLLSSLIIGTTQVSSSKDGIVSNISDVVVSAPVVTSIAITPNSAQILRLNIVDFTANGTFSDGSTSDVTNSATWSSLDSSIASITSSGTATGLLEGNTSVTAFINSVQSSALIDVIQETLTAISITVPAEIEQGRTGNLTATGSYDNGTNKDITSYVTWTSLDTAILTISGSTASGVSIGNTSIEASLSGQSASSATSVIKEQWWNYLSVLGGSSSSSIINGYVQADSWKSFTLVNQSTSATLRVIRLYGADGYGTEFFNQVLATDLAVGTGVGYTVTLSSSQYAPKVCYTILDTTDNLEKSVCANW